MKEVDQYDEIVSLSYLLNVHQSIRKDEVKALKNKQASLKKNNSKFKKALINEVVKNTDKYSALSALLKSKSPKVTNHASKSGNTDFINDFAQLLSQKKLQIYYPYENKFLASKKQGNEFYVTYAPMEYVKTNEAYKYVLNNSGEETNNNNYTVTRIKKIDDDFLDNNRVFVISNIDPCDIKGSKCNYVDVTPVKGKSDKSPPPYTGGPKLLTYNVNHREIDEEDIISTVMPRFRVKGKDWLGFGRTHQKIDVYRATPDGKISVKNGTIKAESKAYNIGYFRFRKKGVKKGWWHKVDKEFDSDWNMSENEQVITVFSKHHFKGEASVELNTKAGFELDGTKIKIVPTATLSSKIKITVGSAKQRVKAQLSRRQVLSTIVGKGITNETYTDGGVQYNVKTVGIFSFYFKHYYTDL